MSENLLIYGNSGSGKTTSIQTLDPNKTFIIDADKKGLSWRGWKNSYNMVNKNYLKTSDINIIEKMLLRVNTEKDFANIEVFIIDTINGIMIDSEMERMKENG